ncbi:MULTISPECIES: 50S ribosomal protein L11 methyltransferase [Thiorhodovibrio]|uniref:50S ribosomal protein L11 methyltransferase n=1 Tax=Thiorhodovibrio TaxID=61593 RepID=UPI0019122E3F|nr:MULTISPECIES: 50S ribosomal protein L11 methyltransferase [Thiorhodovibrio]MBK5970440.1 50S ribosomal protein L11 methyltransferase [Thiorhodovibrio winogradskyi]WPL11436.1 Ribosomal protein L11 methyltransferase [Thiorhodovibrio litoralis]
MAWLQLALIGERAQVPLIEAALENAGALSVTLDDPADQGDTTAPADLALLEPAPGAMPLWALVRVTALFEDDPASRARAEQTAAFLRDSLAAPPELTPLADQVWERAWLAHWQPRQFGHRLWVCPHGQESSIAAATSTLNKVTSQGGRGSSQAPDQAPTQGSKQDAASDAVIVSLDPGLAFGTGSHPTTALCLEWLDGIELNGKTVLDYGCGSGILAIAALKLGAARVIAVDHDPQALTATAANAAANGVGERLSCHAPGDLPDGRADVLIANILAGILIELAPTLIGLCAQHGRVALSGILEPQIPPVVAAYGDRVAFAEPKTLEQWALLSGLCLGP